MITATPEDVIEINRYFNDTENPWVNRSLLESAFSSYHYYDSDLEQICSIFRGLVKNHAFSDGNKRTASAVLVTHLKQQKYHTTQEDLCIFTLDVVEHNYDVPEIAEQLEKILIRD